MQYNYHTSRPIAAEGSSSYGTEMIISQTRTMKTSSFKITYHDEGGVPDPEDFINPKDVLHVA